MKIHKLSFEEPKRFKRYLKLSTATLLVIGATYGTIKVSQWFDTHRLVWQKPILIQTPVYVEKRVEKLISPEVKVVGTGNKKPHVFSLSKLSLRARTHYLEHPFVGDKLLDAFDNDYRIIELVSRESGLNMRAINPESGAAGLFQALPPEKMNCDLDDLDCQIEFGKTYIKNRYGSVEKALQHHDEKGWY